MEPNLFIYIEKLWKDLQNLKTLQNFDKNKIQLNLFLNDLRQKKHVFLIKKILFSVFLFILQSLIFIDWTWTILIEISLMINSSNRVAKFNII